MTIQEFLLLFGAILSSAAGQFFLKTGALKLGKVTLKSLTGHILAIAFTPELLIGLTAYGLGAIAYILVLTRVKLSIAGPTSALIYVFSVLVGYFAFQESIPVSRFIGLFFIILGVVLVTFKN